MLQNTLNPLKGPRIPEGEGLWSLVSWSLVSWEPDPVTQQNPPTPHIITHSKWNSNPTQFKSLF